MSYIARRDNRAAEFGQADLAALTDIGPGATELAMDAIDGICRRLGGFHSGGAGVTLGSGLWMRFPDCRYWEGPLAAESAEFGDLDVAMLPSSGESGSSTAITSSSLPPGANIAGDWAAMWARVGSLVLDDSQTGETGTIDDDTLEALLAGAEASGVTDGYFSLNTQTWKAATAAVAASVTALTTGDNSWTLIEQAA